MKLRGQMPALEGATVWYNSSPIKKSDLIGNKPTLIHFWSVSCDLCKDAMPNINKFRYEFKDKLNMIAVHMPRFERDMNLEDIKRVADAHDITHPIFVDNKHTLTNAFANQHVPSYYVFDEKGKLRHFQADGGMKMLRRRINRILGV